MINMKKTILAFLFIAALIFIACTSGSSFESKKDSATIISMSDSSKMVSAVKYTCTMHPEVISDTPGHCPKCGMTMVPIKDSTSN
jgi:hypothetical protein